MKKKKTQKSDLIVRKMFRNAVLGIIVAEISNAITTFIDATVTGRFLGETALAATSMAAICYTIAAIFSGILSGGSQKIATSKIGDGNVKEANQFFSMVLFVTFALSTFLAVVSFLGASVITQTIGISRDDTDLFNQTIQYIRGFVIGTPANILVVVLIPFAQLEGKNKTMWLGALILFIVDTAGDLLNVFVFHGGVFGMGLATALSYWVNLFVLYSTFLRKESMFRFRIAQMDFHDLGNMIKIGLPRATKRVGNLLRPIFLNRIILAAGQNTAMAAYAVQSNTKYVTKSLGVGVAGAAFLLISIFIGEKNQTALRNTIKISLRYIVFFIGAASVVYFAAAPFIVNLFYSADSPSYDWAIQVLRCHAVSLPFLAFNEFYIRCIHSVGKINTAHIITFVEHFALITLMSAILGRIWGVQGIWFAIAATEILLCTGILVTNAVKNKAFCEKQNLASKQTYRVQLFFEEMCMLIINHGFDEKKKHTIDVRIYKDEDSLVLRTKDDCRAFTAMEQTAMYEKASEGAFMGVQIVVNAAKDVKYIDSMNINNFIVTL